MFVSRNRHKDVKKLLTIAVLLGSLAIQVQAQDRIKLDRLQAELKGHVGNDSAKVDLLIRISGQHGMLRTDSANYFLHEALALSKKIRFPKGEAKAYTQLASCFPNNFDSTYYYLRSAVDAAKRAGDKGTLGYAYYSLSYALLIGTYRLSSADGASVNADARAYIDSAAATYQAKGDTAWWINSLSRQAGIFMRQDSMPRAGATLRKALAIQAHSSVKGDPVATLYFTKGDYHFQQSEFDSALVYHQKAVPILEEQGSPQGVSYAYGLIARDHAKLRQFDLAIENAEHALGIAEENGLVKEKLDALTALCQVHTEKGDLAKALTYYERLYRESDSLNTARLQEITSKFDVEMEAQRGREKITVLLKDQQIQEQKAARQRFIVFALLGGLLLIIALATSIYKGKKRSDELLHNILPEEVAAELKKKGHTDARHFDEATILFTDFKGFTQASEKMSPQDLVEELNTCFKAFDGIITARGIEKIKTIGDAYMCAGGLPEPKSSSPGAVVHAALEMQAFMKARKAERDALNKPAFEMRVGIHTGPVVAGIVGVKKFQYDIWGDTVNTASRMESSGEVGQVNISEATCALVKNEPGLRFTPRGKVQAKGKGEMEMYFVGKKV